MLYISLQVGLDTTTKLATHYNKRLLALHILRSYSPLCITPSPEGGANTWLENWCTPPTTHSPARSRSTALQRLSKWSGKTMNDWPTREERRSLQTTRSSQQRQTHTKTRHRLLPQLLHQVIPGRSTHLSAPGQGSVASALIDSIRKELHYFSHVPRGSTCTADHDLGDTLKHFVV